MIDDLPCRTCGYNLRTLDTAGVCPECATPIAASLRSELLREADPNWLWHMHSGCKLLYWGIWGAWMSVIFSHCGDRGFSENSPSLQPRPRQWGPACSPARTPAVLAKIVTGNCESGPEGSGIVQFAATLIANLSAPLSPAVHLLLEALQMLALTAWGAIMLWYLDRLGHRTSESKIGMGFRVNMLLFLGASAVSLAALVVQGLSSGVRNPLSFFLGFPFRG